MVEEIIDVGTSKFNIEEIWFKKFCNKYENLKLFCSFNSMLRNYKFSCS